LAGVAGLVPGGVRGLVPKDRLEDVQLLATDQDRSWGTGEQIAGPSEALAMAVAGRSVALDDLSGSGVDVLRVGCALSFRGCPLMQQSAPVGVRQYPLSNPAPGHPPSRSTRDLRLLRWPVR
jgi:hypothetical protein